MSYAFNIYTSGWLIERPETESNELVLTEW